ncbi:hypothetical protein SAMN05216386_0794 [Nitrosospira briensis]|uniref:Uncharacterized protein n=1 Tax=Nitrosospira briensis TaxID=35799 RepID=A0A1I4YNG6_9PROT|nr:hypothetical protein SAMN05216386_0794 [Nitrosospira briensis]
MRPGTPQQRDTLPGKVRRQFSGIRATIKIETEATQPQSLHEAGLLRIPVRGWRALS